MSNGSVAVCTLFSKCYLRYNEDWKVCISSFMNFPVTQAHFNKYWSLMNLLNQIISLPTDTCRPSSRRKYASPKAHLLRGFDYEYTYQHRLIIMALNILQEILYTWHLGWKDVHMRRATILHHMKITLRRGKHKPDQYFPSLDPSSAWRKSKVQLSGWYCSHIGHTLKHC